MAGGNDAANRYEAAFESAASDSALLSIEIDTVYDPTTRRATVNASLTIAEQIDRFEECVVQVVLIEDGVVSRDRVFDRTVRKVFSDEPLLSGGAGDRQTILRSLDLPPGWNPATLSAVVWVHRRLPNESSSREVLNASQSQTFGSTPVLETSWGGIKSLWR